MHPRRLEPSAQFSASISRPQPSARPRSLISSGFFSPPISSHNLEPTPSAAVRAIHPTHLPSAAVRAAKLAHHQRLLLPTYFQPLPCTHAVRNRPCTSPHPLPVRSRPCSQAPSSPLSAPISRPQPSAQPSSLITSGIFSPPISISLAPTPSAAVRAVLRTHLPSAAVHASKVAHHQRLLLPTNFQPLRCTHAVRSRPRSSPHPFAVPCPSAQPRSLITILLLPTHFQPPPCTHAIRSRPRSSPHPFAVRSRPRSQGRSSPAASSPHPFRATPLHPRRPQPSAQFSAPICRPQPSAQPRSLITSGFFSPTISRHPLAPTPSAAVRAVLRTHLPSAAVRAAKVAHHQRLLLPTNFQPLRCTHAVRSRPRSSPHPFAVRSRPQPSAAKVAHHQRLLLPTHFQPPPCTHAVRSRPRSSPHPLAVRSRAQPRSLITSGFFSPPISSHPLAPTPSAAVHAVLRTHLPSAAVHASKVAHHQRLLLPTHFQPPPCTHAVRSRPRSSPHPFAVRSPPRSQGRSSPAASSPHPFPATPLHPRRPQPSTQFSAPICRPQPSAQPRSLITSGFFSQPISSHPLAATPSAAVRAVLRTHLPSAAFRAAKVAHHQRLLPFSFLFILSLPLPSCPFLSLSVPSFPILSLPFPSPHPFPATPLHPRCPQPSAQFSTPICQPQPSAQLRSLITSGFFSTPISSHSVAPTPSAAVRAVLRTHLPTAAVRAAKVAHHQRLLLPTHFQPLRCTHAVRSRPRSSPHPLAVRSRPRSQGRSSPAASSPHPFPATPLHPRRPQPSTQFSAPICSPQPSAQPRSLITSGFFSPPISSHSVAPTPSAAVRAVLRTHLPSAAVRAAKVAHHQRLLLPTHFQPLRCTHAVRSRPRNFRTHLPSAAVRAAKVAPPRG